MSEDIRKMIDKVKNFKSINENKDEWEFNVKIKISNILPINQDGQSIEDAIINVKDGLKSHSINDNVSLLKINDKYEVLDGFHRIAEKILNGEEYVTADVKLGDF